MTSRDFCFWLQGYFEITGIGSDLNSQQVSKIKSHLALVFKHEIDPSMGDKDKQDILDSIHNQNHIGEVKFRC